MRANILATLLAFALGLWTAPSLAQPWNLSRLPDPVSFGVRVELGDIDQARTWLERGLDPEFIADRIGTGLMIAAWNGDLPMMELFVAKGANVNKTNELGETAIMHAAWRGNLDALEWLLARGAKINQGHRQWSALHYAAFSGQERVVGLLIERGADINAKSTNGSSPLMMAVYEGREAMVRQLIDLGADRSVRNDFGEGAMDWAFKHERHSIARLVGTSEEFTVAANRPKTQWAQTTRSLPVTAKPPAPQVSAPVVRDIGREQRAEIDKLMSLRAILAAREMHKDVQILDRKISVLRFKLAKPGEDYRRPAVLEISARRTAPKDQKARLIVEPAKPR